ncbi:glycosyltransferase involved in cell wall biosynthesis [Thiogranum longum]|uniref:Glycosyltransferase involved in cell wall biosynthesis n=1 Tax=Thiogranum longum TaxID=1537524 RepID=A0A4R1HD93_9GAMM|nr:glycosyltransferase [Thiogranum longum]TCK19478.1 glycosyltransferase involved in cell wall biosynthesis [Thiogranum longum]
MKNDMPLPVIVFVAHGISRETIRLQPWRYLYELAVRMSNNGRVILITDASGAEYEEAWSENLTVVSTRLLSVRRMSSLVRYINSLGADRVWWSVTPRSIIYYRAWKKLGCRITALITCPLYPWALLVRAGLSGVPWIELKALIQQRGIPRFMFVRLLMQPYIRRVIVQSQSNRKILVESGLEKERIDVVPVGIDPEDRKSVPGENINEVRKQYGFGGSALVFSYMGAVRKIRGIDVLIKAFSRIAANRTDACLVVLARGADKTTVNNYREKFRSLGLEGRVKIIGGWLDREQVWAHIEACDVVVLPFVVVPSDVPIAILEALAREKPVIGTRVDGIPELVEGRGLVVESMDDLQLAEAMKSIVDKTVDYQDLSRSARKFMKDYPDWDEVYRMVERLENQVSDECSPNH